MVYMKIMVKNMKNSVIVLVIGLLLSVTGTGFSQSSDTDSTLNQIVLSVQKKYENLAGLKADFTQILRSASSNIPLTEKGDLRIKKGGFMHWEYTDPEEKYFVCDGDKCYMYFVEEELVQTFSLEQMDINSAPLLFFTGKGKLARDFNINSVTRLAENPEKQKHAILRLTGKTERERFDYILMYVNRKSYLIERMRVIDLLGNETDYRFSDMKEEPGLNPDNFKFRIPEGVEVVTIEE